MLITAPIITVFPFELRRDSVGSQKSSIDSFQDGTTDSGKTIKRARDFMARSWIYSAASNCLSISELPRPTSPNVVFTASQSDGAAAIPEDTALARIAEIISA